jgi:hypothetical protein
VIVAIVAIVTAGDAVRDANPGTADEAGDPETEARAADATVTVEGLVEGMVDGMVDGMEGTDVEDVRSPSPCSCATSGLLM